MKKIMAVLLVALMVMSLAVLAIPASAADSYLYYENDFSDPATLADFSQYRSVWEIRDGALWVKSAKEGFDDDDNMFGYILFNTTDKLTDYTVEADFKNVQTSTGICGRCDLSLASEVNGNCFGGYLGFISNNVGSGAMGRTSPDGAEWGGNYSGSVVGAGTTIGANLHIKCVFSGTLFTCTISDLATGGELYTYTVDNTDWTAGTFGIRMRLSYAAIGANTIGNLSVDNLKVYTTDKDWKPATTTAAPAVTTAAPVVTTAAPTGSTTTAAPTAPVTGDSIQYLAVLAIAAAAALAVTGVIYSKKRAK